MAKKAVIIGGVAAGMKTAARLRRRDPEANIIVLERGPSLSYGACGFPYYISGEVKSFKVFDHIPQGLPRDAAFFKNTKGIDARTGCNVTAIDRKNKTVAYEENGLQKTLPYDYLVLGTGATPVKLNLPGADLKGIHSFWFPWDVLAVEEEIKSGQVKEAAVIGAGFIGMEVAECLRHRGVKTAIIEAKEWLLPNLLDEEMAELAAAPVKASGIELYLGAKCEKFLGENGRVSAVVTDKGTIKAQLVIVAIGVRPNVELAAAAGLTIGPSGCIAVNEHLQTSDPYIYAGGDCAENTNRISGAKVFAPMGSTANKHGRVIADHIAGDEAVFPGVLQTGLCRLFQTEAGATGLNEAACRKAGIDFVSAVVPGFDRLNYMPGAGRLVLKLLAEPSSGRVLGLQAVGQGAAKRIDTMVAALSMGATLDDLSNFDIAYAPPFNGPIDNLATAANVVANKIAGRMRGVNPKDYHRHKEDYTLVDVRLPFETKAKSIAAVPKKISLPLGELRQEGETLADKKTKLLICCQINLRGYEAETILRSQGYEDVSSLEGGLIGWPYETE